MSDWLMLTLAMAASVAVVVLIAVIRARRIPEDYDSSETPDVIEYMTMMTGVIYAIVLGLAIAGVWEARGAAEDTVAAEAFALHEVSERAAAYPERETAAIRARVDAYVSYTVHTEWPVMADAHRLTGRGDRLLADVRRGSLRYEPRTDQENRAAFAIADHITAATEARQARALSAEPTLPPVVWFGLVAGALVSVGMLFALQIQRSVRELLLAGLFSALIAFLLFLVWQFDAPYSHSAASTAGPFVTLFPDAAG